VPLTINSPLNAKEEETHSLKCGSVKAILKYNDKGQQNILINGKPIKIDQSLDYNAPFCMTLKNKKYIQIEYSDGASWIGSLYVDTKTLKVEDKPYSQETINHLLLGN
jgi:hypothetical protein